MLSLVEYIFEKQAVNFGEATSNYGNCIIFAGGAGSGKGFVKKTRVLANFKSIDVDDLKTMYIRLQKANKIKDDKDYDLKNPDDTSELHAKVKSHGWKNKQRSMFWNDKAGKRNKNLPNILWDMVSDDIDDVKEIAEIAKKIGYKVTLVWVVCNIDTARQNNSVRDRHVHDSIIIKGHKGVRKVMFDLFENKYPEVADLIDAAWIVYSAGYKRILIGEYEKSPVIRIKKNSDGKFVFTDKDAVTKFLDQQMPIDKHYDEKKEAEKLRKETTQIAKLKF